MSWLLASEAGLNDPFVVPPVNELFEFPALLLENTPFAINRTVIIMLFATLLVIVFMVSLFPGKVVPGKLQSIGETVVDFVQDQIAYQVMGDAGRPFVPFLMTVFLFVYASNLFEIIPFVNFPPTSRMAYPAMVTIIIYVLFIFVGIKHHGLKYFKEVAFPPGVPVFLYILVTPIEIVSTFIVRPLTLAVRLFANMLAGHIILTIIFLTIHAFLFSGAGTPIGLVALVASPLLVGFEGVVGLLQAYIITILAAVYLDSSINTH
ncbi:MAG: F0F1 ATP synthase subunit A [Euzebya sp.]